MATIKHIFKGESLSMLFAFPAEYDMARIQSHGIWIGGTEFAGVIIGQGIELKLASIQTDLMSGNQRVSLWIDDTILGVRKPYVGDITVGNTNALPDNVSTSEVYDVIVNVDISVTSIEAGDLMFNYVKGDPFTYDDFTPEQIAELQQPAADAIASIQAVELAVEQAEALRVTAEQARQTNTATAISNAEQATDDANNAASLANEKAGLANNAATLANEKAGLAATATTQANAARDGANSAAQSATNLVNSYATDLAAKELKANKQNSLTADGTGTKFPTVDAVNEGLLAKTAIKQTTGTSETAVMSQKSVTDELVKKLNIKSVLGKQVYSLNRGFYINSSGNVSSALAYGIVENIDVSGGYRTVSFTSLIGTGDSMNANFYDINNTRINTVNITPSILNEIKTFNIPISAKYLNITVKLERFDIIDNYYFKLIGTQYEANVGETVGFAYSNPLSITKNIGGYIRQIDGGITPLAGYFYSSPILLKKGELIKFSGLATTEVSVISLTDINGSFYTNVNAGTNAINTYYYLATNDCYVAISCTDHTYSGCIISYSEVLLRLSEIPNTNLDISALGTRVETIENDPVRLSNAISIYKRGNYIDKSKCLANKYILGGTNGSVINASGFYATDYIELEQSKEYYWSNIWHRYFAFYDENKQYISGSNNVSEHPLLTKPFTIPVNAKYGRFTIVSSDIDKCWINDINEIPENEPTYYLKNIITKKGAGINPCDYDGKEIAIFNKILCIGDSLTYGVFNISGGSTSNVNYSYPTYLNKLTGITTVNMGNGGLSSSQWYSEHQNDVLSGYDCAIIQLGVNDNLQGTTSTLNQSLANIVDKLKSENTGIKIFIATIIPAYSYNDGLATQIIRDFVAGRTDCYLIDLSLYGNTKNRSAYNAGHLSAYGYLRLAMDYAGYISKIIGDNPDEFRDIQLTGTSYLPFTY